MGRVPMNVGRQSVRSVIWQELVEASSPLIISGYSSLTKLIDFAASWDRRGSEGPIRLLFGSEPFDSVRRNFGDPKRRLTEEMRRYFEANPSISLLQSRDLIRMIEMIRSSRIQARHLATTSPLHAKLLISDEAITVGSSNFTQAGLVTQLECNVRFERQNDRERFEELSLVGENLWSCASDFTDELVALIEEMLSFVSWEEALAVACHELLEGAWAASYLSEIEGELRGARARRLWPSQLSGIAEALWILSQLGSVLVADSTGSGKTKMGAYLTKAVRDSLWSSGRVRRAQSGHVVLVAPPGVTRVWRDEALSCGLQLEVISQGKLSRGDSDGLDLAQRSVQNASVLCIDEAHNFLNVGSQRSTYLRQAVAEHVLLFTATPISGGARDILSLVGLLGPENFADATLDALETLESTQINQMSNEEIARLRREIGGFTVRRTKAQFNELVEREPERYRHPVTNRVCRYPLHELVRYKTEETAEDSELARRIDGVAGELVGLGFLDQGMMTPPRWWQSSASEWVQARLRSSAGLARYNVLAALRSSRAALAEHLLGTNEAQRLYAVSTLLRKSSTSGGMISKIGELEGLGPPVVVGGSSDRPDSVHEIFSAEQWIERCRSELERYREIVRLLALVSSAREDGKAGLIASVNDLHRRVLAFDAHPITLAVLADILQRRGREVIVATGEGGSRVKARMGELFGAHSQVTMVGLCSDALNEGLNLQGASAVVHLDVPSTLRVAEQRVGRVDRLDSPFDKVELYWPSDGEAFLTSADRLLARRAVESDQLLGSNIEVPGREGSAALRSSATGLGEFEPVHERDGLRSVSETLHLTDVFDPVRSLIGGSEPLVDPVVYRRLSEMHRSRRLVGVVHAERPWLFVDVASGVGALPRWMLIESSDDGAVRFDLVEIVDRLRALLIDEDRTGRAVSASSLEILRTMEAKLRPVEFELLPQRLRKGFLQLHRVAMHGFELAGTRGHVATVDRWREIVDILGASRSGESVDETQVLLDPGSLGQLWLDRVRPYLEAARQGATRRKRFVVLRDIESEVLAEPIDPLELLDSFESIPVIAPFSERMKIVLIGDPSV